MKHALYGYQEPLVSAVCADLSAAVEPGAISEVVLAACPGAGKTLISINIIDRLLCSGAVKRVLVLAHATTVLRENYVSKLKGERVAFSFAEYVPRKRRGHVPWAELDEDVIVALPQTVSGVSETGTFDLIVVDEAHQFYGEPMVTKIIERTGASRVLLLTGTPAPFVGRGLPLHAVSLNEIYESGASAADGPYVADVRVVIRESSYDIKHKDYNELGEVDRSLEFKRAQTAHTLDDLRSWFDGGSWQEIFRRIGQSMIVCRSQAIASQCASYFSAAGVSFGLSTSETDPSSRRIGRFQADPSIQLLIVVARASIGFDHPPLGCLIDMTGTINIDRIFQMVARTVRPNGTAKKLFVKLASKEMFAYTVAIQKAAMLLSGREFYEAWNGDNLDGVKIPGNGPDSAGKQPGPGGPIAASILPPIDDGFMLFQDLMAIERSPDGSFVAGTTLGSVARCFGVHCRDPESVAADLIAHYRTHGRAIGTKEKLLYSRQQTCIRRGAGFRQDVFDEYLKVIRRGIVGNRYGKLVVIAALGNGGRSGPWRCRCDCGSEVTARQPKGRKSCGCLRRRSIDAFISRIVGGEKIGMLTAMVEGDGSSLNATSRVACRCDCGGSTRPFLQSLIYGRTASCGCNVRARARLSNYAAAAKYRSGEIQGSVAEIARATGMCQATIRNRIARGIYTKVPSGEQDPSGVTEGPSEPPQ